MLRLATVAFLVAALPLAGGKALAQKSTPDVVTLTPKQWACVQARLPKMLNSASTSVRVSSAPCTPAELRGPGASNATAAGSASPTAPRPAATPAPVPSAPIPGNVTRAPFFLTKEQLGCIETQLPKLMPSAKPTMTVDLKTCAVAP